MIFGTNHKTLKSTVEQYQRMKKKKSGWIKCSVVLLGILSLFLFRNKVAEEIAYLSFIAAVVFFLYSMKKRKAFAGKTIKHQKTEYYAKSIRQAPLLLLTIHLFLTGAVILFYVGSNFVFHLSIGRVDLFTWLLMSFTLFFFCEGLANYLCLLYEREV